MDKHTGRADEGMALLLTIFFVSIALVALTALASRLVNENYQVRHLEEFNNCFQGVESALAQSKADLESGGDGYIGVSGSVGAEELPDLITTGFEGEGVDALALSTMPDVKYFAFAQNWATDGVDNNGDGLIDGVEETGYYTVYGFGQDNDVTRAVESVMAASNVNVWNNAIFAGAGSVSGAIQGNCSIHGSVHILGDQIPAGGEAIVVLDMMGASLIHNNYLQGPGQGLTARMLASVPPLPQTLFNGEQVATLNSTLRVKRGLVSLNSASEIGELDVPGNSVKETMDGTYNEDGWTGQRTVDDGGRGDPTVVYSDNGWDEGYDLGNKVTMPMLDDPWRWPGKVDCYELGYETSIEPGSYEPSPDGDNYGHAEFFSDVLSDGTGYNGDVHVKLGGSSVYINLTRPGDADPSHRVKDNADTCTKGDDYLYFNAATGVVEINGQVEINGDFEIEGRPGQTAPVYYTGRAAILVHGDVTLDTDLLACNDGVPSNYVRCYPERNFFGIMAENNMLIGVKSQCHLMGGFYAQGTVTSNKQSIVLGTFVAEYFDMGQQVPDIYQVPALVDNLPLGMIGNWPMMVFEQVSWRELEAVSPEE